MNASDFNINTPSLNTVNITRIHFVQKITRHRQRTFRSSSLTDHLLHFVTEGVAQQESNGIQQILTPGKAIWYDDNSMVRGEITQPPWTFYTVSFECPNLPAIPADQKVLEVPDEVGVLFQELLQRWTSEKAISVTDNLHITSLLYRIISLCYPQHQAEVTPESTLSDWWEIESAYSRNLTEPPPTLEQLAQRHTISPQKINSLCQESTGMAPIKRLKTVRLSHARGLLLTSELSISEIAWQTGYPRVQDLSRACKQFFGLTPSKLRLQQEEGKELPE